MPNSLDRYNSEITKAKQTLSTAKQPRIDFDNYSANTQEDSVSRIRNNLPFSDIQFSFPVTDRASGIRLPAFLSSHSDTFSPNWSPTSVYGRADPIPIYKNTSRSISLGFKIPNFDIEDAIANFKSLGILVKNLYPVYKSFGSTDILGSIRDVTSGLSPNQSIVGAPLARIKFANLICNSDNPDFGLLGYITNLGITIDVQTGFLIYADSSENENLLFPRTLNLSISFTPLHEHKVGWGTSNNWLGANKDNYPFKTRTDPNSLQDSDSVSVGGSIVSGDYGAITRAALGS